MVEAKTRLAAALIGVLVLAGCAAPTPTTPPTEEALPLAFVTQAPIPEGSELMPDALSKTGVLFLDEENGCLMLQELSTDTNISLVWPAGYIPAYDPAVGEGVVLNPEGRLVGQTGLPFAASGAEMSREDYEAFFGVPLDTHCAAPYWVITQVHNNVPQ